MLPALLPVLTEPWEPAPSGILGVGCQALALQDKRAHWITAEDSLSSASALQCGGWRKNCELWKTSCLLLPPSPVPLWSWYCILLPALHHPLLHLLFPTFSGSHWCSLSSPSLLGPWLCSQADLSHLASFITPKLSNLLLYWDLPKQLETPLPCLTLTLKGPQHPVPPRPPAAPHAGFSRVVSPGPCNLSCASLLRAALGHGTVGL